MGLAHYCETLAGTAFAFVDVVERYGHMIELFEPAPGLFGFYAMVAAAAVGWDGSDPIRTIG